MKSGQVDSIKLFKTIFDQTPISTQIFTPDGETLMVNKAWEELWNLKFSQVKSYNILHDQQLVETGVMPHVKKGFTGEMVSLPLIEYAAKKTTKIKGAATRWLSAKMYPIKNDSSQITHLVLQHEDVTNIKKWNEAIKVSEEKFRTLTSHAPVGIFLTDSKGNCLFVNDRWCKITGMKKADALGTGWSKTLHSEDKKNVYHAWNKFTKTGREFNMKYRFMTPKGKSTWVSGNAVAIYNQEKIITGYMGTVVDITDQMSTLTSLEISEERLRLALDAGKIGVWDWDLRSNTLAWTDNVYEIHDVKKKKFELTLENFVKLIHPDDKKFVKNQIDRTLKEKTEFNIEFRIVTHKGATRWVTTRASILLDENKKPIRLIGATTDITKQKLLEQEKSDFISMAAHELKTPITSMKIFIELIHRDLVGSSNPKSLNFALRIKEQTNRLAELVNDLLDVSRIETGKLQLRKEDIDLGELLKESVENLQATTSHTIEIKNLQTIQVNADKYRIYQILVNLIANAVKYSPNKKKIIVSMKKTDDNVVVSVKDYGIGIDKDKQSKIFNRLYQISDTNIKSYPGLGMGLYISKEIIERHNGRIWVKSEHGKGSTFYFSLGLNKT